MSPVSSYWHETDGHPSYWLVTHKSWCVCMNLLFLWGLCRRWTDSAGSSSPDGGLPGGLVLPHGPLGLHGRWPQHNQRAGIPAFQGDVESNQQLQTGLRLFCRKTCLPFYENNTGRNCQPLQVSKRFSGIFGHWVFWKDSYSLSCSWQELANSLIFPAYLVGSQQLSVAGFQNWGDVILTCDSSLSPCSICRIRFSV